MTNLSYPRRQKQLEKLLQILRVPATAQVKWQLLDLALTHPSVSAKANYEQLEFVGDAVVRLVAAEVLWEVYSRLESRGICRYSFGVSKRSHFSKFGNSLWH